MKPLTDPAESRRGAAVAAIVVGVFLGTLFLKLNPPPGLAIAVVQFGAAVILRAVEIKS